MSETVNPIQLLRELVEFENRQPYTDALAAVEALYQAAKAAMNESAAEHGSVSDVTWLHLAAAVQRAGGDT